MVVWTRLIISADLHPISIARTPTSGSDNGSLEFPGFGPGPCLDLNPIAATETGTGAPSRAPTPSPPPYQHQGLSLPPSTLSTDRRAASAGTDCPRFSNSTLHIIPSVPKSKNPPICEIYSGSSESTSSGKDLASQQLRDGLTALFQAPTSPQPSDRRPSKASTVAKPLPNEGHILGSGSSLDNSTTREIGVKRLSSPFAPSTAAGIRNAAISEPVGGADIIPLVCYLTRSRFPVGITRTNSPAQNTLRHTISGSLAELDGTEPVLKPAELDATEPLLKATESKAGADELEILDRSEREGSSVKEEYGREQIAKEVKVIFIPAKLSGLGCRKGGKRGLSSSLPTGTAHVGNYEDRASQAEPLRSSDIS